MPTSVANITDADCDAWRENPNINPQTRRRIESGAAVYRRYQRRCTDTTMETFERNFARVMSNVFIDRNTAATVVRSARESIEHALRTNTPLQTEELSAFSEHLDETTLNRLLAIHDNAPAARVSPPARTSPQVRVSPAARTSPAVRVSPAARTSPAALPPLIPGQSALHPRANAPPFRMQTPIGTRLNGMLVSRYEVGRFFSRRLQLGLPSVTDPILGSDVTFENLNGTNNNTPVLNEIKRACEHFGFPTQRYSNAIETVESRNLQQRVAIISITDLDYYVALAVRRNGGIRNPLTSRVVRRSAGQTYLELIRMAFSAGLDLGHFAQRSPSIPTGHEQNAPIGSHAEYVAALIAGGAITRDRVNTFVAQDIQRLLQEGHAPPRSQPQQQQQQPFQPPVIDSIPKSAEHSTLTSPTDVHVTCINTLENIKPPFKTLANKLKVLCTKFNNECASYQTVFNDMLVSVDANTNREMKTFTNLDVENLIASMFKVVHSKPAIFRKTWFLVSPKYLQESFALFLLTYAGQQGVGPGVVRSAIQQGMEEITRLGFFTKYDESSNRVFINPNLTLSNKFKRATGLAFDTEEHYESLYEFLGNFIMFMMMHGTGLPFSFSYSILAHAIYKHADITDTDYIAYSMMDFPGEFGGLTNLMRAPETIEYAYLSFNSQYNLRPQDDDVDVNNFKEYLASHAKHRALHTLFPKEREPDPAHPRDTFNRFKALVRGFEPMRKILRRAHVTLPMLDKYLTSQAITTDIVQALIENFQRNMRNRTTTVEVAAARNMVAILSDNGANFPYDAKGIDRPSSPAGRLEVFLDFVERLLMFWSGLRSYSPTMNYFVTVRRASEFDSAARVRNVRPITEQETQNMMPESHTCMTRIDIPESYHANFDAVYKKLVQASYMFEAGVGNFGGGRVARKTKGKNTKNTKKIKK